MKSKFAQISCNEKDKKMSVAVEARQCLETLIERYPRGTPLKAIFPAIARLLGVSVRRVEAMWACVAKLKAEEMDRLRAVAAAKKEESHADKLDRAVRTLEAVDPEFYRAEIDRLRDVVRQLRRVNHRQG